MGKIKKKKAPFKCPIIILILFVYNNDTATCAVPKMTPNKIPTIQQIKSCFSFSPPFDLSNTHFPITIRNVKIEDQKTGKNTINSITNNADVSILTMPSIPSHS